jgi:hypothetical protein
MATSLLLAALSTACIPLNEPLSYAKTCKRFSPYAFGPATVKRVEGGLTMGRTETHFEQVPKSVIEKILAQQDTPAEGESGETGAAAKSSATETKTPARPSSRE